MPKTFQGSRPRRAARRAALAALLSIIVAACAPGGGADPATPPAAEAPSALASFPDGAAAMLALASGRPQPRAADSAVAWRPGPPPVELVWVGDGGAERLAAPAGLALDRAGALVVVDAGRDRLVRLDTATGRALGGSGGPGAAAGRFRFLAPPAGDHGERVRPTGGQAAIDAGGRLHIADALNRRVQALGRDGRVETVWTNPDAAVPPAGELGGLAVDAAGRIYVADPWNHRVWMIDRRGARPLAWGRLGDGPGELCVPVAVALGPAGQVYVLEAGNDRVQVFDGEGRFLATWGAAGQEAGELAGPTDLAVDAAGRVYVADGGGHRVQVFSASGVFLGA
jgi:DNA-binding beta-propeller fold protein YncE